MKLFKRKNKKIIEDKIDYEKNLIDRGYVKLHTNDVKKLVDCGVIEIKENRGCEYFTFNGEICDYEGEYLSEIETMFFFKKDNILKLINEKINKDIELKRLKIYNKIKTKK